MLKSVGFPLMASIAAAGVVTPAAASATPVGPFAPICSAGKSAILARVSGFKAPRGILSIKLYAGNSDSFLEKGSYLKKVEVPVRRAGPIEVCVPVPASGRYAISVRHELGNKKSRADGGGFSGNPNISLADLAFKRKPQLSKVSFHVNGSTRVVPVTLKYLQGMSVRPVS